MENILIYGMKWQGRQLCCYAEREGAAKVAAFVVDKEYRTITELDGHAVITFEEAVEKYPPSKYQFAVSFAYQNMVHDKKEKCLKCRQAGYRLFTFISKDAHCYTDAVGEGTIINPGACVGIGVEIGEGNILDHNVMVGHGSRIGSWNFFAPAATICGEVTIGEHNFLGANCTVMNGGKIGREVIVGAGAVVKNTKDEGVYIHPRAVKWPGKSSEMIM